ncbi:hydrolase [Shewanella marisflavi]|uniref:Hydrolase n=1 Tax=Shewanella marisflavi TaxID=260364 RepID=A0AAC9U1C1_9GAMM|nr:hydrolase [Shewanella marisflavi]ASJ97841.1 hydrolase [Shewanella marisflavi]MCL1040357.1 hydrolase [Shewanella marisflavi]
MLKPQECVLIIVDVQGKLATMMHEANELEAKLTNLIKAAELFEIPIIWLEQIPDKLGATSPELANLLTPHYQPIAKEHFSGWHAEPFRQALHQYGRPKVLLTGIETHICVYQTCRDLLDNQYEVHLVTDAVSSRTQTNKQLGCEMMTQHGALLTNSESLLFELQAHASGDRFKALLKMIK